MLRSAVATTANKHIGLGTFDSIYVAAVLPQSCTYNVFASNKLTSGGTQSLAEVA